jgi:hypothetical protein
MGQNAGETLPDYVRRLANHFGREPTAQEVEERIGACRASQWKMMCHTVIREQFGHVFETFLLMERVSYFAKIIRDKPDKYLIAMFDVFSHLSPRGFAIATMRID